MMQGAMFNLRKITPYLKSFLTNLPPLVFYPGVLIALHSEINSINIFIMPLPKSLRLFTSRIQSFLLSLRFNFDFPSLASNSFHPHTRVCVCVCVCTQSLKSIQIGELAVLICWISYSQALTHILPDAGQEFSFPISEFTPA